MTCLLKGSDIGVNGQATEFKKSCVKCTSYGFKFCGDYNNPFKFTKCAKNIRKELCKLPVVTTTQECFDPKDNPVIPGRPEPIYDKEGGLYDDDCHKKIFNLTSTFPFNVVEDKEAKNLTGEELVHID